MGRQAGELGGGAVDRPTGGTQTLTLAGCRCERDVVHRLCERASAGSITAGSTERATGSLTRWIDSHSVRYLVRRR